jgi:hypothetical protein
MRSSTLLSFLSLSAVACDTSIAQPESSAAQINGQLAAEFLGTTFTLEGEPAVEGVRPKLLISCGGVIEQSLQLDFGAPPASPPPLRGAVATFSYGAESERVEMSWGTGRIWVPRDHNAGQDGKKTEAIIKRFLQAGQLRIYFQGTDSTAHSYTWLAADFGERLAEVRRVCR